MEYHLKIRWSIDKAGQKRNLSCRKNASEQAEKRAAVHRRMAATDSKEVTAAYNEEGVTRPRGRQCGLGEAAAACVKELAAPRNKKRAGWEKLHAGGARPGDHAARVEGEEGTAGDRREEDSDASPSTVELYLSCLIFKQKI